MAKKLHMCFNTTVVKKIKKKKALTVFNMARNHLSFRCPWNMVLTFPGPICLYNTLRKEERKASLPLSLCASIVPDLKNGNNNVDSATGVKQN